MRLTFLQKLQMWFNKVINFFSEKQGMSYIRPLSTPHDVDSDHATALLELKQRKAFEKVRSAGKSCLDGYRPPESFPPGNFVGNRIDVHFKKEGIVPPTEAKRRPVKSVEVRSIEKRKAAR